MDEPTYVAVPILTGGPLAFVQHTHLCLACSKHTCNGERYYIVRKGGELGASNQCASAFFEVSFFGQENEGAYLCRECKRSIDSALKWQEKANKVFSEIDKTSQKLLTTISKRQSSPKLSTTKKLKKNLESANGECSNIAFLDRNKKPGDQMIISNIQELDLSSSTQLPSTRLPDKRLAPLQHKPELIQPLMESNIVRTDVKTINRSCQTSPALYPTQTRGSRTEAVHYLNLSWKSSLNDIVKLICNGNIKKAVKNLLQHQNKDIRQKTIDSVMSVIKEEAIGYAKKPESHIRTTINNIESFDIKTLAHELKTQNPVLWSLMSAASANGPNVKSESRVVTAMSIIFKNRLPTMNALQRNLGIILYNNHLQKDAFHILCKIGITTSYSTMNKDLHRIKNFADQAVQRMKISLQDNGCQNTAAQNDHSYTKIENNTPTSMNDHSYSMNTPECANKPHDNLSPAYRFNLDNLDFHVKVRDMTQDHQNMLKHYVQLMAVKDRVNCEHLPDDLQIGNLVDVTNNEFLPNADDISGLREDIINLTATLLVNHLKCFKVFEGTIDQHPQHTFSKEMKEKSCVVPLGILPLNENKTSEMIEVLKYLHKFVPGHREEEEIMNEEIRDDTSAGMRTIPCGGDQLSVERIRSAHSARFDGDTPEERLEGVIAMVEDFHEKMNFLQVIMDRFYATSSAREQGTLYQLRNVINRRNVVKTVSQDYHADSSFIDLVTDCHVITAAWNTSI